jgi:hypothetical protein
LDNQHYLSEPCISPSLIQYADADHNYTHTSSSEVGCLEAFTRRSEIFDRDHIRGGNGAVCFGIFDLEFRQYILHCSYPAEGSCRLAGCLFIRRCVPCVRSWDAMLIRHGRTCLVAHTHCKLLPNKISEILTLASGDWNPDDAYWYYMYVVKPILSATNSFMLLRRCVSLVNRRRLQYLTLPQDTLCQGRLSQVQDRLQTRNTIYRTYTED